MPREENDTGVWTQLTTRRFGTTFLANFNMRNVAVREVRRGPTGFNYASSFFILSEYKQREELSSNSISTLLVRFLPQADHCSQTFQSVLAFQDGPLETFVWKRHVFLGSKEIFIQFASKESVKTH